MYFKSRYSFRTAFTLGVGAGILLNTFIRKSPVPVKSTEWIRKETDKTIQGLKQRVYDINFMPVHLLESPVPDLYRATDSLTLSEEDLIHVTS